jgi:hypothetical protein
LPGQQVLEAGKTKEFISKQAATISPLAKFVYFSIEILKFRKQYVNILDRYFELKVLNQYFSVMTLSQ